MVEPLRHRQTKGAETDMFDLPKPRHISTLPWLGLASPRRRLPAWLHSVLTFAAAITLPPNFSVSSTKTKNCGRSAFRKGSLADQPLKFTIVGGLTTAAGSHHRSGRCASP